MSERWYMRTKPMKTHLLPLEAHLQVVVELNEVEEMLQDGVRLVFRHANNALREVRIDEDGLPARDGVGANDRVNGLKVTTYVTGRSAFACTT